MKTMKVALLATAALAAVSVSARADDTADIKAQLEALNARIAQLEAAPAVPTGFSLLAYGEKDAIQVPGLTNKDDPTGQLSTISVVPSADMPAAAEIQWDGYVRAAILYVNSEDDLGGGGDDDLDVYARGRLRVTAKTDTSVGEVGVRLSLRATADLVDSRDVNDGVVMNEYWGWWAMTPEWTLGGGYTGSLSNVPYGYDGVCACYLIDASTAFDLNPGDAKQLRLSYASGPLSFGIAIEDGSNTLDTDDSMGVAARLNYSGDAFSAGISGGYWDDDDYAGGVNGNINWQIGAGASFSLGDMANLSIGAAAGETFDDDEYFAVSGAIVANLSDAVRAELGAGFKDFDNRGDAYAVAGGVYWKPVDQLEIGGEAEWNTQNDDDTFIAALVTVYSF
jgi:hypothetical protein